VASFWERVPKAWNALRGIDRRSDDTLDLLRQIYGKGALSWSGNTVTVETAIQVSAALACGRVISQGLATMPLRLLRGEGVNVTPAVDHRLFDRLKVKPNDLQTAFEFKEQMGLHIAFCGNSYVWLTTVSRGKIDELYLLEPGWVTVNYQWPDPPKYIVRIPGGKTMTLGWNEIWHIKGPSWCSYLALEFTKLARNALGFSMALEESQSKFQSQGVQTSGFLSVEGTLVPEQHEKLKKWIREEHVGKENAGAPMILDKAAKWVSQSMSNVDAQTAELRAQQIEEVCRFMGVMPIMVGHSDKAATYASAEQMFLAHLVHTMGPWATRIESSADCWLLSDVERRNGLYWKFNEKALIRMSAADQAEYLNKLSGGPIMARNEARALLDLNPLQGFDEPLTPVNMVAGDPPRFQPQPSSAPTTTSASNNPAPQG